jgi:DNA repair exonuclease SbcCD ATPase subunit
MGDEARQRRVDQLREADARGALTETERAELAVLIEERCRSEAAALEAATRKADERSAALEAQIEQTRAQNRELMALIRDQEAYLADVEALIAQMEERRRSWRQRYTQVTGKPIEEPIPP